MGTKALVPVEGKVGPRSQPVYRPPVYCNSTLYPSVLYLDERERRGTGHLTQGSFLVFFPADEWLDPQWRSVAGGGDRGLLREAPIPLCPPPQPSMPSDAAPGGPPAA